MTRVKSFKLIAGFVLICAAAGARILFHRLHIGINIEFVTTAALLSSAYLGPMWSLFTPVAVMIISDMFIGNTAIFIFTWSAYAVIGVVALLLPKLSAKLSSQNKHFRGLERIIAATVLGVSSSLFFYLWTNFGVWAQGWYPPTLRGLVTCYLMGLPFLKYNLAGNLVFVPVIFSLVELARAKVFLGVKRLSFADKSIEQSGR